MTSLPLPENTAVALERLAGALGSAIEFDQVCEASLDAVRDALGVERAAILLFDDGGVMRFVASRGLSEDYRKRVDGHSPWKPDSESATPILVSDAQLDGSLDAIADVMASEGIRALAFFPLIASGRVIGKLMVYHAEVHAFDEAEAGTGKLLASIIAFGVKRFLAPTEVRERKSREVLKASDDRYRAFIAQSGEAIWRCELDPPMPLSFSENEQIQFLFDHAYLAECNNAMARMYGYDSAVEIEGAALRDLMVTDDPANVEYLRQFIRTGYKLSDAESVERDRNGETKYFLNNLTGFIESDHLHRAWGMQRDVTSERGRQARIAESEEHFRSVAHTVPAIIWRTDTNGSCVFLNQSWSEASGQPIAVGLGGGWRTFFHPDDLQRTDEEVAPAIARRAPFTAEARLRHASGEYRWMIDNGIPQWSADGSFDGYIGISLDIQNRKSAEEALQLLMSRVTMNERRLEETIRTIPGVVWEVSGVPGTSQQLSFVSEHIETLLGYCVGEWHAEPEFWAKVIHPEDAAGVMERARERFLAGLDGIDRFRMIRKDGRVIWTEVRTSIISDDGGAPSGIRGLTLDVTSSVREAERSRFLARAAELIGGSLDYDGALRSLAEVVVEEFAQWCILDVADEVGDPKRFAVTSRGLVPASVETLLRTTFAPERGVGEIANVLKSGSARLKSTITDEDRSQYESVPGLSGLVESIGTQSYMIVPLKVGARTAGAVTIISTSAGRIYDERDLATAIEFADRASLFLENARLYRETQRANRLKDEFLATLSHELRTPMTATLGWAALIRGGNLPAETLQLGIESIEQSTRAQAKLVEDILDVSRIVTGKMSMVMAPIDLWHVLALAIDTVRGGAGARGVGLELELATDNPIAAGDASRLQQIVWNLLSNAVKFTPAGGRVSIRVDEDSRGDLRLVVADTGEGIAAEFIPHVFERFRQADSSPSRRYGGLGLGLAIARNLAELHGGTLTADSEGEGKGSTFTLTLPRIEETPDRVLPSAVSAPMLRGITALVIDDDTSTRAMLQATLTRYQAGVETAGSVEEAMKKLLARRFDVIVTDIGMPDADGFALLTAMREHRSLEGVPVIALSGYARPDDRERALAAGFHAYLTKPLEPVELAREILALRTAAGL